MRRRGALVSVLVTVVATIWSPLPGGAAEGGDTIRVLVRDDGPARTLDSDDGGDWRRVEVPVVGSEAQTLASARRLHGQDVVVERLYTLSRPQDEPDFVEQWYLRNTGQTGGVAGADINAPAAWNVAQGSGVLVAVVDSGVDPTNPDLAGQVIAGWDTVDNDSDPFPTGPDPEEEAHGTMIAGVIAATVNDIGITGIAPSAKILNMRACSGGECWSLDIARAIRYAVEAGADIVNLSLGSEGFEDPPLEDSIDFARRRGVLVIAAAGNESSDIDALPQGQIMIPAGLGLANIVSVAASTHQDRLADFSNFGRSVDVFAPGEDILTLGGVGAVPEYVYVDGTSFAAPVVAGVAALLLSHDPGIGYRELKARLLAFTDSPSALRGLAAHGRIDAGKALTRRFADTVGSVFENTIKWLADQGITEGCNPPDNHHYCPNDHVTRGQMAVFFARAFQLPSTATDFFSDDSGEFFENAANRMAAAGISVGCDTGRYCGERHITRGEMSAMLSRVLGLPATNRDFFRDDGGSTFERAINRIAEAGITLGCNPPANDRFCPDRNVTRGQMAAFLQRSVNLAG